VARTETLATATAFALALVVVVASAFGLTHGFQAFTLESARRLEALQSPRDVAALRAESFDHGQLSLADYQGRWVLVDFVYTRCETLCAALGSVFARVQQRLAPEIAAQQLQLLSVSFDPQHDGPAELAAYRSRHTASAAGWTMARPMPNDLDSWLESFGVIVIPDEWGGFVHNAAIHVVAPDGRLRAVVDAGDVESAVAIVRSANQ
jgi:protein SCO1